MVSRPWSLGRVSRPWSLGRVSRPWSLGRVSRPWSLGRVSRPWSLGRVSRPWSLGRVSRPWSLGRVSRPWSLGRVSRPWSLGRVSRPWSLGRVSRPWSLCVYLPSPLPLVSSCECPSPCRRPRKQLHPDIQGCLVALTSISFFCCPTKSTSVFSRLTRSPCLPKISFYVVYHRTNHPWFTQTTSHKQSAIESHLRLAPWAFGGGGGCGSGSL